MKEELISEIDRHAAKANYEQSLKHSQSNNNEIFHEVTQALKAMSLHLLGDSKEAHSEQVGPNRPTETSVNFKLADFVSQRFSN